MKNYEMVAQWSATVNAEKALLELEGLKLKYPWLRCEESLSLLRMIAQDMPKIINIIKLQEKQNTIHKKFIEVNKIADLAIVNAVKEQYKL